MSKINLKVCGQNLVVMADAIVSGTIRHIDLEYTNGTPEEWDGLDVWAHFAKGEEVYDVLMVDGHMPEGYGLNLTEGLWTIYMHGDEQIDGQIYHRATTNSVKFYVEPFQNETDLFPSVQPSAGEQIVMQARTYRDEAETAKDAAEESAENAEASAIRAEQAKQSTENLLPELVNTAELAEQAVIDKAQEAVRKIDQTETELAEAVQTAVSEVKQTGSAQKSAVEEEGTRQIGLVTQANQTIDQKKIEALTALQTKENAAKEAIEQKKDAALAELEPYEGIREEVDELNSDVSVLNGKIDKKTEKHLLGFDGTHITENGQVLTFAQVHAMLMDTPDFVVCVYNDRAYHPNMVKSSQIVFISSFVSNGNERMDRISLLPSGIATVTFGESESVANKTNAITDANKESESKYPSNKAVFEYAAPKTEVGTLKKDLMDIENKIIQESYNLVIHTENGYVLNNNSLSDISSDYYQTSNFVKIKSGETVVFSTISTVLFRVYIGMSEASTDSGRLTYISAPTGTDEDGRKYAAYTASQDCVARFSTTKTGKPMIEKNDSGVPSKYEEYYIKLKENVEIPEILDVYDAISSKADVIKSRNLFKHSESGYVSIQNTIVDATTNNYMTSDWVELEAGEKIIFSASYSFARLFIGRNTLPTTSGGSRIDYLTAFTETSSDGRKYLSYTATQKCYVRASVYASDKMPMLEKTNGDTPSEYVEAGDKLDPTLRVFAETSDGLSEKGKLNQRPSKWYGKSCLVIGDSLTAANVWQNKLSELLGMNVTTHAKGGIGFDKMLDGDSTLSDPTTQASGVLAPLSVSDVSGKDLIIVFGGYNHRGMVDGNSGDVYPANSTTYGYLQYLINGIYTLLASANNLKCRIVIVNPHCAGKYSYIPYTWDEEYPTGSGRTGETLANIIKKCAEDNRIPCLDLFHTSGINKNTWNVFSASPTPMEGDVVKDQLHLNSQVGYPYLGTVISHWVDTI